MTRGATLNSVVREVTLETEPHSCVLQLLQWITWCLLMRKQKTKINTA